MAYRLHLFGTCRVEGLQGLLAGRVTHPRQLAFLALVGTSQGGTTRDRLGAYLWPEAPPSGMRHLVADALYLLRGVLGKEALTTAGESIRLDPERVSCDVAEFRAARKAGRWGRMLELYEGPFLDGFHGAGGIELEGWIETERVRCQEVALGAVGALVDRSLRCGDLSEAIDWLRRGRAIDPFDEVITRRLMRLLAQIGNRAEAVRAYTLLRDRLSRDLELAPSPETCSLVHEIREGG